MNEYKLILNSKDFKYSDGNKETVITDEIISKYYNIDTIYEEKKFILYFIIEKKKINIFNNLFSKPFAKIIHLSIIQWINKKINNNIFKTFSIRLSLPGITINSNILKNIKYKIDEVEEKLYCKTFDTTNKILYCSNNYKIHIKIKLEYLFWSIEHIINNSEKFIKNNALFAFMKIHTNFYDFTILSEKKSVYQKEKYDKENILYSPNIVFYQYEDLNKKKTKLYFKNLVNTLLELFPNNLDISSKIYPKFTFRLNNNIYLCIGDAIDKIKNPNEYTIPIEYHKIREICNNIKDKKNCTSINKKIKNLSNHILCKFINNKCIVTNINSINNLVKKNNNSINNILQEILTDSSKLLV